MGCGPWVSQVQQHAIDRVTGKVSGHDVPNLVQQMIDTGLVRVVAEAA